MFFICASLQVTGINMHEFSLKPTRMYMSCDVTLSLLGFQPNPLLPHFEAILWPAQVDRLFPSWSGFITSSDPLFYSVIPVHFSSYSAICASSWFQYHL